MHIPNIIPYFCAWGISSKPNVARTSSKDDIDRMDERDCLIFSRSERLLLGATIALCVWLLVVLVVEVVGEQVGCVFGRVPGGAPHKRHLRITGLPCVCKLLQPDFSALSIFSFDKSKKSK